MCQTHFPVANTANNASPKVDTKKAANKSRSRGKEKSEELLFALRKLNEFYKTFNNLFFQQIGKKFDWSTKVR